VPKAERRKLSADSRALKAERRKLSAESLNTMITSATNKRVKYVRSLYRRRARNREKRFIAEGTRLVEEALRAQAAPVSLFCTPDMAESSRGVRLLEAAHSKGVDCCQVTLKIMALMTDTVTPQGVLSVVPFPRLPVPDQPRLILILDGIRDPGNLGTILRTAAAAGVDEVLTLPGTVDVYAPKVVRAGMGAHFRIPIEACGRGADIQARIEDYQVLLAAATEGVAHWEADWSIPTALIVGGETQGVGETASSWATSRVMIPMASGVESLNVASATAVLLFEAVRQTARHAE